MTCTAIVVAGGGAAAAFPPGVQKQLHEAGVRPKTLYGTSGGALDVSTHAYAGPDELIRLWRSIRSWGDVLDFNAGTLTTRSAGKFNSAPLREKIDRVCQGTPRCEAVVCKVRLSDGAAVYSKSGDADFAESVQASAAVPYIMEPVNGFIDGGARHVLPLAKAIKDGHEDIIAILCQPWNFQDYLWTDRPGFFRAERIFLRYLDIALYNALRDDIVGCLARNNRPGYRRVKLTVYAPPYPILDASQLKPELVSRAINIGLNARPIQIPEIDEAA